MKEIKKYNFTVEGETEKLYLEWLCDKINDENNAKCNVKVFVKVCQSPRKASKLFIKKTHPKWAHLCDIESNDDEHVKKFKAILQAMHEAVKENRCTSYTLGYSNYAFDLWMILHKRNCSGCLTSRTQYLKWINSAYNTDFISLDHYKAEKEFTDKCLSKLSLEDVRQAVKQAEQIEKNNKTNGNKLLEWHGYEYYRDNPSLSIHIIIKKILTECNLWK